MNLDHMYNQYINCKYQLNYHLGYSQNLTNLERPVICTFFYLEIDEMENGETLPEGIDVDDGRTGEKEMRAEWRLHAVVVITRENVHPSKVKIRDKSFVVQKGRRSRVAAERRESAPNSLISDVFFSFFSSL